MSLRTMTVAFCENPESVFNIAGTTKQSPADSESKKEKFGESLKCCLSSKDLSKKYSRKSGISDLSAGRQVI
jgi:hypothetical protein